ncbi:MAG: type IX secretion system sortase PorU [Muribaculum sp.]|nr:type IX secretion system sortase PorU [Muribaculum sp.]
MKLHIISLKAMTIRLMGLVSVISISCIININAANPEKYAGSSAFSDGKWVKIEAISPGIQTLTRQNLKSLGFDDPSKVYVYGYGGRMTSEALSTDLPDDIPPTPVIRKADGSILFYATGYIGIQTATSTMMNFDHVMNPYCESSYYFLSDKAPAGESETIDLTDTTGMNEATTFIQQLVHEQDLIQSAESGREYLGEDFRSAKSQDFKFDLTDNADGNAKVRVKFATNATGQSSILVSANGNRLPSTNTDKIAAVTSSEQYYRATTTTKNITDAGTSLTLNIEYSQAGVVSMARLDWIEVEYAKNLQMRDSKLYFHINAKTPMAYKISGATENTVIWDVTDPANIKIAKGNYDSTDNTLTIGVPKSGLREFIAFNPDVKGASVAGRGKVANQNIHALSTPDMVIISPDMFTSAAERIANIHRENDGMTVHVLTPERIYNEFSGGHPDLSAFRKLLKMWYDRGEASKEGSKTGYCLLMGRPTYDQKRKNPETQKLSYPNTLIWQSSGAYTETSSYCTDDYIGMLEDETAVRTFYQRKMNIGVGRYPVTSLQEAQAIVDKLENYINNPNYGVWRNNVMVIADDGDSAQHLDQAQLSIEWMQKSGAGPHCAYERVYLDAFEQKNTGTGLEFPDAKERMLNKWEKEGIFLINYIGHANPKEWGHEKLLTWNDITTMSNQHLPILYAATCSFGKWDAESVSGAEVMLSNTAGGAIAVITPSRTVYIAKNKDITNSISDQFMRRASDGHGQRIGDILRHGKNNCTSRDDNMNRYHLFGDPALRMPVAHYTVRIDSIAGSPVATEQADSPTVMARSSVSISGKIVDTEGNTVDFNGPVQYVLYDAEKSITTHGWGKDGLERKYEDRNVKLATGSTQARNGEWSATILMPSEISNNYTPALLTVYAYDSSIKKEATGSTERLYVYGYDESAGTDTEGPEIENFVINSYTFTDGDLVHSNPVAMASFKDASGINISDAGIGHKMSLVLDNTQVFEDLGNYFVPDTEEEGKGSISYPISNLEPGEHELTLTVWDNANNSSSETIKFMVGINLKPEISEFTAYYNPTSDMVTLKATSDRSQSKLDCKFECFSLNGDLLWSMDRSILSGRDSSVSYSWDLKDHGGKRLNRGIYVMRATITTSDGLANSMSKKIGIPAK